MSLSPTSAVESLLDTIRNAWPTTSYNVRFGADDHDFSDHLTRPPDPQIRIH